MRFSVIIPTYNRWPLIQEAIDSVKAQSFSDWELIVADDGSEDESVASLDSDIRCIELEHSGFPGLVRNRAAALAKGEYLAFLDSDDLWLPQKLELQNEYLKKSPGCRILHSREIWRRGNRIISQIKFTHSRSGMIFEDALEKCIIGPSTAVIRRDLFEMHGGFREDLRIAEDYELWLRICDQERVGYIDTALTVKRADHGFSQLTEQGEPIEYHRILALKDLVFSDELSREHEALARDTLKRKLSIYIRGAEKRGHDSTDFLQLLQSL
jgi:glycosyltransferase involved in cell wall biosynthesis